MKKVISLILCVVIGVLCFSSCKAEKELEKTEEYSLKITYDSAYSTYDSSAVNAYEAVCNAVINGEESARINVGLTEKVRRLFYTSFPLNALVKSLDINKDRSGLSITYTLSAQEHKKAVDAFKAKIEEIVNECSGSSVNEFAIRAYAYVSSHITPSESNVISCYETVMNGKGSSFSYAQLLSYLLQQGGLKSCYVTASDAKNAGWGLCQVMMNDKWFYLDPMTEYYDNKGTKLVFFGMTEKDLKAEGLTNPTYSDSSVSADSSSLDFDACRACYSYEIKDNSLFVTKTDGNIVQIAL